MMSQRILSELFQKGLVMNKFWVLGLMTGVLFAKEVVVIGTFGETFPVAEKSLLTLFKERLQQVDFSTLQDQWVRGVRHYATRPTPLDLKHAESFHQSRFDPSIVLTKDIMDAKGHIIYAKGKKINPLDYLPNYQPHWLFIDADDEKQMFYAQRCLSAYADLKVILVNGDVPMTSKILQKEVYFDQSGHLVGRFEINETPAFIYRKDAFLMLDYGVSDA